MFLNPTMLVLGPNVLQSSRKNGYAFIRDVIPISLGRCLHLATGQADQTDHPTPEEPHGGREWDGRGRSPHRELVGRSRHSEALRMKVIVAI